MKTLFALCSALLWLFPVSIYAQKAGFPIPRNVMAAYESGTRSMDGKPGLNYWQNRGDYTMKISFEGEAKLSGTGY